jgi:hypothetical protein
MLVRMIGAEMEWEAGWEVRMAVFRPANFD